MSSTVGVAVLTTAETMAAVTIACHGTVPACTLPTAGCLVYRTVSAEPFGPGGSHLRSCVSRKRFNHRFIFSSSSKN
ncbi:MAG: hypothetical protein ACYTG0_03530 [Planctomycetota bacterium]